jgi:hypothetical protein
MTKEELIKLFEDAHFEAYGHASSVDFAAMSVAQIDAALTCLINTNF